MNVGTKLEASGALDHLRTLKNCVDDFIKRHGKEGTHDLVIPYVLEASSFKVAIARAVDGKMANGKKFHFGTCVRNSSKAFWSDLLIKNHRELLKCSGFERLYDAIADHAPWGIGDFSKYVVSQRVGAWRKIEPVDCVYLHAGPRRGYKALFGKHPPSFRIAKSDFPKELQKLKPSKIEDFLCEYRETLGRIEW